MSRKISIITPSLNRKDMLEGIIHNVMAQGYPNFEHIIIDGGSTDGTQEVISKYPHLHFVSGTDEGVYDALNKGIEVATGEVIGFLNTDDFYAENIFGVVAAKFEDENVMAVAGQATVFKDLDKGPKEVVGRYSPEDKTLLESSTIGNNYFNAWFFRASVFKKIGKFDVTYRVAGDRDFMFRFCLSGLAYATVDKLIYEYRWHSGSLTFDHTGDKRKLIVDEHLWMTKTYLQQRLPSAPRKLLLQLRTREALVMVERDMKNHKYKSAIAYFSESINFDATWLPGFLWMKLLNAAGWPVRTIWRAYKQYKKWLVLGR
jgi:glycosyltransferase involved in cell wall biosynthesis